VVLLVSQLVWTSKVEEALSHENPLKAMKDLLMVAEAALKQIVNKARDKLPDLLRKTFSALIVLEVHAKDVIEMLVNKMVKTID
jgi:dynein heavy chain